jgi:hypothetical protein
LRSQHSVLGGEPTVLLVFLQGLLRKRIDCHVICLSRALVLLALRDFYRHEAANYTPEINGYPRGRSRWNRRSIWRSGPQHQVGYPVAHVTVFCLRELVACDFTCAHVTLFCLQELVACTLTSSLTLACKQTLHQQRLLEQCPQSEADSSAVPFAFSSVAPAQRT